MKILFIIPKKWLSHWVGIFVHQKWPLGFHLLVKSAFIKIYAVDVQEAEKPYREYATLGEFFTRKLRAGSRPIAREALVSPCDGTWTRFGELNGPNAKISQIKGREFFLEKLIHPHWSPEGFEGGLYYVMYLAPYNYHRVHSPVAGKIKKIVLSPGELWPVNTWSVKNIEGLFWRNERLSFEIETVAGRVLVIMVGATNVGKMTTRLNKDLVGNLPGQSREIFWEPTKETVLSKGDELGCFGMGSTVIMILDSDFRSQAGQPAPVSERQELSISIKMGERIRPL